jgi:hypothetical protein
MRRLLVAATLAAAMTFAVTVPSTALADSDPTVDQIYKAAEGGHLDQAQGMMNQVLADHPSSARRTTCRRSCTRGKARPRSPVPSWRRPNN